MGDKIISGFSKLSKKEKISWIQKNYLPEEVDLIRILSSFNHSDEDLQLIFEGFSENTISNFYLPYGIVPNLMVNGKYYAVPMVVEESSVVAAASSAAKFWLDKGGFKTKVLSTTKLGQVHFTWNGPVSQLRDLFEELKVKLIADTKELTLNMEKRGGGILDIELRDMSALEPNYYQLMVSFETCDSMGANFINSILEQFGYSLEAFIENHAQIKEQHRDIMIIMAILSNYTPECLVQVAVDCPVEQLSNACTSLQGADFADKFSKAIRIAEIDPHRATTHNKGIFNGIDAVVMATGNDFRAIEACGHTYAAKEGQYQSLSHCEVKEGHFRFWMDIPLVLGTVGGLTNLHPLAKLSLNILGNPNAEELMQIVAATGLAQNFAALRSLVTTGIQSGHMKMHLTNILNHLEVKGAAKEAAIDFFKDRSVSFSAVRAFLEKYNKAE